MPPALEGHHRSLRKHYEAQDVAATTLEQMSGLGDCHHSPAPLPRKEKKEEEGDVAMLPMAGAVFIATCIGGPAILVAGLKLGMFAAIHIFILIYLNLYKCSTINHNNRRHHGLYHGQDVR